MYFTSQQLRTLLDPFRTPELEAPPLPELESYNKDRSAVTLLSVATSEASVIRYAAIPRNSSSHETIEEIHGNVLRITGANEEQIQLESFQRDMGVIPTDLIEVDPTSGGVRLSTRGETALALGGTLLDSLSIKRHQRLRDWTGGRFIKGPQKTTAYATPQLHRIHIINALLPPGTQLSAKELVDRSDGHLGYRNALGILSRMAQAGIVTRVRVQESPPKYSWRITTARRSAAEAFVTALAAFSPPNQESIGNGLAFIDTILSKKQRGVARALFRRGFLSAGSGARPEPLNFNEQVQALFSELTPGTLLSAAEIGEYLGEPVTLSRMRRQVNKPGLPSNIECIEIPHSSGQWYKFRLRRPDFSQA
jgi:hypothetical protein